MFCNIQAMKLIPEEWSIGVISQFLSGSVRSSLHRSRNTKILRSLARGENIKASVNSSRVRGDSLSHTSRMRTLCDAYHEEHASH